MGSYYYLVASLPMLRYDAPCPITVGKFLSECKENMGKSDYEKVACAIHHKPSNESFLKKYQTFCKMVRLELSEQRAQKLGINGDQYRNNGPKSYVVTDAVRKAVSDENVLRAEMSLIELQWKYLDEMAGGHLFDIEGVLSYALKLGIIQRRNLFTREEGNSEFKRLFSKIESEITTK